jgi:hypothetical protein
MSRFVIIDDTDPTGSIQYSGPWFGASDNNAELQLGTESTNYGAPFNNTLHGVNANASLSFNFSGMTRLLC